MYIYFYLTSSTQHKAYEICAYCCIHQFISSLLLSSIASPKCSTVFNPPSLLMDPGLPPILGNHKLSAVNNHPCKSLCMDIGIHFS